MWVICKFRVISDDVDWIITFGTLHLRSFSYGLINITNEELRINISSEMYIKNFIYIMEIQILKNKIDWLTQNPKPFIARKHIYVSGSFFRSSNTRSGKINPYADSLAPPQFCIGHLNFLVAINLHSS